MTKCVFCGRESSPYRGVHLITNVGTVNFYCDSKCRRNALNLGRDNKKVKWTNAFRVVQEKAAAKVVRDAKTESDKQEAIKNKK